LQRSLGNAAVTQLLARQQQRRGARGHSGPTRIDREDPLIRTVHGPILRSHGDYEWHVRYELPLPADNDGWLIQELYQDSNRGAGDHFWECWRLRGGEQYPEEPIQGNGFVWDDLYRHGVVSPSPTGWHRHVGVIRFYPGALAPEFGSDWGADSYITRTQPSGWTGQGTRHDAYSEWDYRRGRYRNGFVAYAGMRELRRGDRVRFRARATGRRTGSATRTGATP
jgi:hypothetical protein